MTLQLTHKKTWNDGGKYKNCKWDDIRLKNKDLKDVWLEESIVTDISFDNCFFNRLETNQVLFENGAIYGSHFEELCVDDGGGFDEIAFKMSSFNKNIIICAVFEECDFCDEIIFTNCDFDSVTFLKCSFKDVRFENCTFRNVLFEECSFYGVYSTHRKQDINHNEFRKCSFEGTKMQNSTFFARTAKDGRTAYASGRNSVTFIGTKKNDLDIVDCIIAGLDVAELDPNKIRTTGKTSTAPKVRVPKAVANNIVADESDDDYATELNIISNQDQIHMGSAGNWNCSRAAGIGGEMPHNYMGPAGRKRPNIQPAYSNGRKYQYREQKNKKRAFRFVTSGI